MHPMDASSNAMLFDQVPGPTRASLKPGYLEALLIEECMPMNAMKAMRIGKCHRCTCCRDHYNQD